MERIICIFGKKGSGKTTLSKEWALRLGGKVVFLSPVEQLTCDYEAWTLSEIAEIMPDLRSGEILVVRNARVQALDLVASMAILYRNYTIIIDEVNQYKDSKDFAELVHYCRHFNCFIVANTRRYADMPRLLTSQADILAVFKTNEPRDLDYIRHFTDVEFLDLVKGLKPRFEYAEYPTYEVKKTKRDVLL